MSKVYIRAATVLYHEQLAPEGQVFNGSETHPLPHPGDGWVDTPAKFSGAPKEPVTLEQVLEHQRTQAATDEHVDRLRERVADADRLISTAERRATDAETALTAEREAHGKTRTTLEETAADLRKAAERVAALQPEAEKVPGLTEQLEQAQRDNGKLAEDLTAARAEIAKFDKDGDGKVGGSTKAAGK